MKLFDSHAHLTDRAFDEDRDAAIQGVDAVLECATSPEDLDKVVALSDLYPQVWAAVGIHPEFADRMDENVLRRLEELVAFPKVKAIGEIGLDYHYDGPEKEAQKHALERQLALAAKLGLPVSLHNREATGDMLAILQAAPDTKGVMHCFSGSVETAKIVLDLGLYLGIGGIATFKNANKLLEVIRYAPIDRILLETDAPYLAPEPLRGTKNVPANIAFVAEKIASLKGISKETVCETAYQNAATLFGIEE